MIIKKKQINKRNKRLRKIKIKNQRKIYIKCKKNNLKLIILILIILFIFYSRIYIPNNIDLIAEKIYNSTGKLSFNELDRKFKNIKIDYSKYNNIDIGMSFNNDYYLLSTVTIASILKNMENKTYVHIHIIETGDFVHETRKKLNSLKYKINI